MICDRCDRDVPVFDRWVRPRLLTMDLCPTCSEREFGVWRRGVECMAGTKYGRLFDGYQTQITRMRSRPSLRLVHSV